MTIREHIAAMLEFRRSAEWRAGRGEMTMALHGRQAAERAERRARAELRAVYGYAGKPEAPEWLTDEELDDERRELEAAGNYGARWTAVDAEIAGRIALAA